MPTKKNCPACGVTLSMEAVKFGECDSCGFPQNEVKEVEPESEYLYNDMDELDSEYNDPDFFDEFGNNALL